MKVVGTMRVAQLHSEGLGPNDDIFKFGRPGDYVYESFDLVRMDDALRYAKEVREGADVEDTMKVLRRLDDAEAGISGAHRRIDAAMSRINSQSANHSLFRARIEELEMELAEQSQRMSEIEKE